MSAASSSSAGAKALRRSVVRMEAHLDALESARRRQRLLRVVGGPVLWGVAFALVLLLAGHYARVLHHPWLVVTTVTVCSGIVVVRAWGRTRPLFDVAVWVDQRAGLDERVSSALAFLELKTPTPMMQETVVDAEQKLLGVPHERVARPASRRWVLLPVLLLPLPLLAMLPPRLTAMELASAQTRHAIQATGGQLVATAEELEEDLSAHAGPDAQAAVAATREAGAALEEGAAGTQEQALERLQTARQQVDDALREDAARELLGERLRANAATRQAGEALARGDTQAAADALRRTAATLREQDVSGARGQQLAEDLRRAAQALPPGEAQAAANRAAAGAEAGRQDVAQDGLRDLADQVEDMTALGEDREVVEDAADALREARNAVGDAQDPAAGPADIPAGAEPGPGENGPAPLGDSGAPDAESGEQSDRAGAGLDRPDLARDEVESLTADPGNRVTVAGQLLERERTEGSRRGGGPRVQEDTVADMQRTVEAFRTLGEAEIAQQSIPPGYRALVRDYFSVLEDVAAGRDGEPAP